MTRCLVALASVMFLTSFADAQCGGGFASFGGFGSRRAARIEARQSNYVTTTYSASAPALTFKSAAMSCDPVTGVCTPAAAAVRSAYPSLTEGTPVQYPANPAGMFPAGTGTVEKALPLNKGGKVYSVRSGEKVLPVLFEDGELWKH